MNLTSMYVASLTLEVLFNRTDIFVQWNKDHFHDCIIDDPAEFVSLVNQPGKEIMIWTGCHGVTGYSGPLLGCDGFSGHCKQLNQDDPVQSGEVNSDGVAYGGGYGQVRAFNLSTDEFIWKNPINYGCDSYLWMPEQVDMIFSDLQLLVVTVGCSSGSMGTKTYGLDLAYGDILWKEDFYVSPVAKLLTPALANLFVATIGIYEVTRSGVTETKNFDFQGLDFICQSGSQLLFAGFESDFWALDVISLNTSWTIPAYSAYPTYGSCASDSICVTGNDHSRLNSKLTCVDSSSGVERCSTKIPEPGKIFLNGTEVWMTNSTGLSIYDAKSCSLRLFYKSFTPTRILFYADVALLLWADEGIYGIYAVRLEERFI